MQRQRERDTARSVGTHGDSVRARADLVRTCACSGQLKPLGYEYGGRWLMCGSADSVHHRMWGCQVPEVVEAREKVWSAEIIAEALQAGGRRSFVAPSCFQASV
eukprot:7904470-Pyramimonas_sp.AAC.1